PGQPPDVARPNAHLDHNGPTPWLTAGAYQHLAETRIAWPNLLAKQVPPGKKHEPGLDPSVGENGRVCPEFQPPRDLGPAGPLRQQFPVNADGHSQFRRAVAIRYKGEFNQVHDAGPARPESPSCHRPAEEPDRPASRTGPVSRSRRQSTYHGPARPPPQ